MFAHPASFSSGKIWSRDARHFPQDCRSCPKEISRFLTMRVLMVGLSAGAGEWAFAIKR